MCVHTRACVHARACVRVCVCARAHLYLQTRVRVIIYLVVDGTRPHDDSKAHEVLVHEVVRIVPPTILVCVYVCRQSTRVCVRVALKTCANGAGNGSEPSVNTERNPEWRVKVVLSTILCRGCLFQSQGPCLACPRVGSVPAAECTNSKPSVSLESCRGACDPHPIINTKWQGSGLGPRGCKPRKYP